MLTPDDLARPLSPSHHLLAGVDTGTYLSCVFVLFPPETIDAFVVQEFPNYRYVGGEIELLGLSIPEWAHQVTTEYHRYLPHVSRLRAWADANSQFRTELQHYDIHLAPNNRQLELRVEIAREYVQHRRVHLAPWLSVLPYELEHAVWPDETTSAGRFQREKRDDHTLDCLEHVLSRRPRNKALVKEHKPSFLQQMFAQHRHIAARAHDPHLGSV